MHIADAAFPVGRKTMKLSLWQIDAFAEKPFEGNPAAVVPLREWLDASEMQRIANENNLAETAFLVPRSHGHYGLRWFTPAVEVDLCGHATLASAWVIFEELQPAQIHFLRNPLRRTDRRTRARRTARHVAAN
jgi:PhzF family phenazine biosynthesis protein